MNARWRYLTLAGPFILWLLLPTLTRAETPVQAWNQYFGTPDSNAAYPVAIAVDGNSNVVVTGWLDTGFATIEYSNAGLPLWTNLYQDEWGAVDMDHPTALAVDSSNNVIVAGVAWFGGFFDDYVTIKYSSAGVPLWTNTYNGPATPGFAYDGANAVTVDHGNNIIVTGSSSSDQGGYDYATLKYTADGALLWLNRYDGPAHGDDEPIAIAADSSDNVIVTGTSIWASGNYDFTTIKYSSAGVPLWTNRYDGPGNDFDAPNALAVDSCDNVIVTGTSLGSGGYVGYATIKYSGVGAPLWTNRYESGADNYAARVAVDASNNVIVTGWSTDTNDHYCSAMITYSSAGLPLWTNFYAVSGGDAAATSLAIDSRDNVIVSGSCSNSATRYDYVTLKYSSTGVPLWTNLYNGSGNSDDDGGIVTVDRSGNVLVTGSSAGSGSAHEFATLKYIPVPSPLLTALPATNDSFQLRVDDVLQPGTLVLEASTNLVNWTPVFTNTTPTNVLFYTVPDADTYAHRFYRGCQFP